MEQLLMRLGSGFGNIALNILIFLCVFATSCSQAPEGPSTFPVKGKVVTSKGAWQGGNGTVEFRSVDGSFQGVAMGQIQPDGSFELGTSSSHGRSPGAVVGKQLVTIMLSDPKDAQMVRTVTIPEPVTVKAKDDNYFELTVPE